MTLTWKTVPLDLDRRAWELAVEELPRAPLSTVLARAQEIKETLCDTIGTSPNQTS